MDRPRDASAAALRGLSDWKEFRKHSTADILSSSCKGVWCEVWGVRDVGPGGKVGGRSGAEVPADGGLGWLPAARLLLLAAGGTSVWVAVAAVGSVPRSSTASQS